MSKKQSKGYSTGRKKDQDQWVLFLPESCTKPSETNPTFCTLRHPKTEAGCKFLLSSENSCVHEVLRFNDKYRSWFIGDSIQSDGSIYMSSPVDPVFLVLPYLIKAAQSGKYMQLEQIVEDSDFPECNRLCSCEAMKHLGQVCEVKGADDYKVYRYDKTKLLRWLKAKATKLAAVLKEKKVQTSSMSSHTSTYIVSSKSTCSSPDDLLRFAHGMLAEYLPVGVAKDLQDYLGIQELVHEKPQIKEPNSKRSKTDITPTDDYSKHDKDLKDDKKNTRLTLKQKQLEKVDRSGMKSISSFFSPKAKK